MPFRFGNRRTERFAQGQRVAAFHAFERTADLRLRFLLNATSLMDLRAQCLDGDWKR